MKLSTSSKDPYSLYHHLLVYLCDEGANPLSSFKGQPSEVSGILTEAVKGQKFTGKLGGEILIPATGASKTPQVLLLGLGKGADIKAVAVQKAAAAAAAQARKVGAERVGIVVADGLGKGLSDADFSQALAEGFVLGSYEYRKFKTGNDEEGPAGKVREVICYVGGGAAAAKAWNAGLDTGGAVARGVNVARDLSNAPGNDVTPVKMAQEAQRIAKLGKMTCKVLGPVEVKKEKMGGVIAVSQGSDQPPRVAILEYKGSKKKAEAPIVIVGKGITFDSGGISLKPAPAMDEMKHDMSGAAAVLGLFDALRDLKPKCNVVGIIACAENMPSGKAYRPGDVVKTRSGKTVEILNTDAEGRMVLCDALDYAKNYKPKAIIDLATLTGACVIALGDAAAGLMGNDDKLKDALVAAGTESGERVWPMPLFEDYTEQIKSSIADIKNVGGREAGSLTAGAFLQQFVDEKTPWAHLDIAGTAWTTKPKGLFKKGATGFGVRILANYLATMK